MHTHYDDILSRISEAPKWWDEKAVPRFNEFSPHDGADIYANEIVLMLITCQSCDKEYEVAMSYGSSALMRAGYSLFQVKIFETPPKTRDEAEVIHRQAFAEASKTRLADLIRHRALHYGDPPNTHCCAAGATMNSVPRRVLQYWSRFYNEDGSIAYPALDWKRDHSLEVDIVPDWAE